jgi:hypothetical protein
MNRFLITGVMALSAFAIAAGASAAERRDYREHHYFWIEAPAAPADAGCDSRTLSAIINRGDICPAEDAPTTPPLVVN